LQQTGASSNVNGSIAIFLGAVVCMVGALVLGSALSDLKHQSGPRRLTAPVMVQVILGVVLLAAGMAAIVLRPF